MFDPYKKAEKLVADFLSRHTRKPDLIVILGPTASGKTGISVHIAKQFDGEIISADCIQIYTGMDIGSAKVTKEEMQGIPHHGIDLVRPDEEFNLYHFKKYAEEKIKEITARGKVPIIVGSASLWIDALINNYQAPIAKPDPGFRQKMQKLWEKDQGQTLWKRLRRLDPASAEKIPPANHRYLIRQLEIIEQTGKPASTQKVQGKSKYRTLLIGLDWPREILYDRINQRVELMMKQGLLQEVKKVYKQYPDPNLPAMKGQDYRELIEYIDGQITLEEAIEKIKLDIRHYAKRQLTWWRRNKKIKWIQMS